MKSKVFYCVLHGDKRETVFISDRDKQEFITLLADGKEEFGFNLYAFALLESQVHLVLRPDEGGLDELLSSLLGAYACSYSKRNCKNGYVFEERYESKVCHEDQRLVLPVRYVHYLPVVFGHSHHPNLARWTSHLAYLGDPRYSFIDSAEVLAKLSPDRLQAQRLYQSLSAAGISEAELFTSFEPEHSGDKPSGVRIPENLTLADIAAFVSRETGVSLSSMRGKGRGDAVVEARRMFIAAAVMVCSFPVSEVAKFLGVHHSYVSRLTYPKSPAAESMAGTAKKLAAALAE